VQVKSFEGGSDPMLLTSATPGSSAAGSAPSTPSSSATATVASSSKAGAAGCTDAAPPGSFTCAQQKGFGKCDEAFMTQGNFCAATCGRCSGSEQVKSSNGPGGRKLQAGVRQL
jgi:hypothetical protein